MKWLVGPVVVFMISACSAQGTPPSVAEESRSARATSERESSPSEPQQVHTATPASHGAVVSGFDATWERHTAPPTGLSHTVSVAIDGRVYVIGGMTGTGNVPTVEEYVPTTDSWRRVADLPVSLDHAMAVALGGKVYVFGGYRTYSSEASSQAFAYDPAQDRWTEIARMPQPRAEGGAAVVNGIAYVVGGLSPGGDPRYVMAYTPGSNQWKQVAELPSVRGHLVVVSYKDHICAIGGRDHTQVVHCYDPSGGTWRDIIPKPLSSVWDDAAVVVNDQIWVTGRSTQVFDGTTWRMGPLPLQPRWGHGVVAVGERIYMLAGIDLTGALAGTESMTVTTAKATP